MAWLNFIYTVLVLVTGVPAIWRGDFVFGLSGILAPLIAEVAGAGILDGFLDPQSPTIPVAVLGAAFIAGALYWVHSTAWNVQLFGLHLSGIVWCLIGAAVGAQFRLGQGSR